MIKRKFPKMTSGKFNQTMVMIIHNKEIAQLADKIIRIEDDRVAVLHL
jgi:putative ABC transport system ATP-binding protein